MSQILDALDQTQPGEHEPQRERQGRGSRVVAINRPGAVWGAATLVAAVVGLSWWFGGSDERTARTLHDRGIQALAQGEAATGRAQLEALVETYPASTWSDDALWAIGQSQQTAGEAEAARRTYERLVAVYPDSPLASEAMARAEQLTSAPPPAFETEAGGMFYEVQPGDTLSKIAREFGTTVKLLQQANGLRGDLIFPKQRLRIITQDASARDPAVPAHTNTHL